MIDHLQTYGDVRRPQGIFKNGRYTFSTSKLHLENMLNIYIVKNNGRQSLIYLLSTTSSTNEITCSMKMSISSLVCRGRSDNNIHQIR